MKPRAASAVAFVNFQTIPIWGRQRLLRWLDRICGDRWPVSGVDQTGALLEALYPLLQLIEADACARLVAVQGGNVALDRSQSRLDIAQFAFDLVVTGAERAQMFED